MSTLDNDKKKKSAGQLELYKPLSLFISKRMFKRDKMDEGILHVILNEERNYQWTQVESARLFRCDADYVVPVFDSYKMSVSHLDEFNPTQSTINERLVHWYLYQYKGKPEDKFVNVKGIERRIKFKYFSGSSIYLDADYLIIGIIRIDDRRYPFILSLNLMRLSPSIFEVKCDDKSMLEWFKRLDPKVTTASRVRYLLETQGLTLPQVNSLDFEM